jgi:DNA-binding IclR family transcriptional regulator
MHVTRDWTEVDVPSHCSALGNIFYAYDDLPLPTGPLERPTRATLADVDALRSDGQLTRQRGWAATMDELEVGLTGVAVPVHRGGGELIAALGISGPTPRLEGRLDDVGRHLLDHSAQLSTLLRGHPRKEGVA